jgi:coenzyme F420-reducing hydrogenase beta subunit
MVKGVHDPRVKNEEMYRTNHEQQPIFHKDIGWHLRSIVGWRKDPTLRSASASGGLVTWCLEKLLEHGAVTRVASVRLARNSDKGMFEFYPASSVEELRSSAGSTYQPIEISGVLKEIASNRNERWAVVGVPCLCAGIRNLKHLRKRIPFVFGLACGMYQNIFYTEMLLEKSGIERHGLLKIDYRLEATDGSASNYRFRGVNGSKVGTEVCYRGLPRFLGSQAYFRLNACNFCKDVFAETADACFMDAWLPEYQSERRGTSLVVIRNPEIDALFRDASAGEEIAVSGIASEKVVRSQLGHVRRKRETVSLRMGSAGAASTDGIASRALDRASWWLQRRTQKRSKKAWSLLGRRYGATAFWIAMADLLVQQKLLQLTLRAVRLPGRVTRKLRTLSGRRHS